jgi:hypothetical protein
MVEAILNSVLSDEISLINNPFVNGFDILLLKKLYCTINSPEE